MEKEQTDPDLLTILIHKLHKSDDLPSLETIAFLDAMTEKSNARKAEILYYAAMAACQGELTRVANSVENKQTSSEYAPLEAIIEAAAPIYTKHGFSLSFYEEASPIVDMIRVAVDIQHAGGHCRARYIDLPPDVAGIAGKVNKTNIHGKCSTFTYGRRYLMCLVQNIPTGDDKDGNQERIQPPQEAEIRDLLRRTQASVPDFLKYFNIKDVPDLPAVAFPQARHMLTLKIKKEIKESDLKPETLAIQQMDEAKQVVSEMMGEPVQSAPAFPEIPEDPFGS